MKADSDKAYKEEGILDEQFMNWISGKLATVSASILQQFQKQKSELLQELCGEQETEKGC